MPLLPALLPAPKVGCFQLLPGRFQGASSLLPDELGKVLPCFQCIYRCTKLEAARRRPAKRQATDGPHWQPHRLQWP